MILDQWNEDPEFKELPDAEKGRILSNYFNSEMVDDEFNSLEQEEQSRIRNKFLASEGIAVSEKPEFSFGRLGHQALANIGEGIKDIGHAENMMRGDVAPVESDSPLMQKRRALQEGFKDDPHYLKRQEAVKKLAPEISGIFPEPLEGSSGIVEDAIGGMARFAPAMVASAVSPPAGIATTFAQITGMKHKEYTDQGIENDRATRLALLSSALQTPIEFAGNILQIGFLGKMAKSFVRGPGAKAAGTFVANIFKGIAAEGSEEFLQAYPDEIINIVAANPDLSTKEIVSEVTGKLGEITASAGQQAKVGAVGGGLLAGAGGVVMSPALLAQYKSEKQIEIDEKKSDEKPADIEDKPNQEKERAKLVERFEKDLEKGEVTLKDLTEQRAEMDEQELSDQDEMLAGAIDEAIVKRQKVEAKAKKAKPYEQKPTERKPPIGGRGEKKRDVQARERNQREIDARNLLEESPEAVKQIAKIEPEGVRADAELGRVDREIERKVKQVKKEQQPDIVKTKAEIEPLINRFARRVENHLPHGYTVSNEIKVNLRGLEDVQGALDLIDPILKVTKDRKKRIDTAVRTAKQNPELQDLIQNVMKGLGNDQAYQRKLKKAPPAKPLRPEIPTQGKVQEIEKPVIPPKTTGVKATESEKPIRHRKHAPTEAIGVVTGGKVDQLEEKFEIGWADEIGAVKKGSDLYYDVVGVLSGGPADQFFDAGLSVKRRGDKAAPEKPTVAEPHTIYDLRKSWPDLEFEIIGSGKDKLINIKTGVSEEFRSQWAGSAAGRGHIFDTARRLDKHLKEYFAKKSEEKLQASLKEKRRKAKEFGEKAFKQGKKRTPSQDENVSKLVSGLKPGEAVGILDAWTKAWDKANIAEPVSGVMMTPDNYVEHVKTQEKSGIKYTDEMEVEETGQVVKVEKDAAVMLRETDEKIESYNQLLDCLAS